MRSGRSICGFSTRISWHAPNSTSTSPLSVGGHVKEPMEPEAASDVSSWSSYERQHPTLDDLSS
jgi:hypothetical protein